MFILRKLLSEGKEECNIILGSSYNVIDSQSENWDYLMKEWESFKEEIYLFLVYNDGKDVMPLYKKQGNYIMTSDGKTFCNLTRHIDKL
jgi:hypothetical protein